MVKPSIPHHNRNGLYLLASVTMIFMTLAIAIQPLYLRNVIGIPFQNAGAINANIQVVTELLDLLLIGYLGFLSDRFGRIPIIVSGFLLAAVGALLAPASLTVGMVLGVGALPLYYLSRIIMSLGTGGVWPMLAVVAGDFSDTSDRTRLMTNCAFMMAFGATIVYFVLMQIPQYAGIITVMLLNVVIAVLGAWVSKKYLIDVAPRLPEKKVPLRRIYALVKGERRLRLTFVSAFFARSDMVLVGLFLMLWFVYFADLVGIDQQAAAAAGGRLLGIIGITVFVSIPLWGLFIERLGRVTAIALGMGLSGIGFVGLGFIVNPFEWPIYLPAILVAIGQAGCLVAPQVLTTDLSPREILGSVLGVFFAIGALGAMLLIQVGGFLFDAIGPHAPFVATGVANLLIMSYALWVLGAKPRHQNDLSIAAEGA
jgi:MFS family permease